MKVKSKKINKLGILLFPSEIKFWNILGKLLKIFVHKKNSLNFSNNRR